MFYSIELKIQLAPFLVTKKQHKLMMNTDIKTIMQNVLNGRTHCKNLAANVARLLKCA